jgi:hypothetical protein
MLSQSEAFLLSPSTMELRQAFFATVLRVTILSRTLTDWQF